MFRHSRAVAAAALVLVLVGTACGKKTTATGGTTPSSASEPGVNGNVIEVGDLHSLSGTMAISEVAVKNAELLAIDEINAAGGVLGKQLKVIQEDGASDWPTFAEKAKELLTVDHVAAVFGGWTSASRKAMLPVFEQYHGLLYYPVQYEGLESSPDIFYTGATTNQQIVPALDYLKSIGKTKLFLLGSDYVFPRTANEEIKAYAKANGMTIVDEQYTPLGATDYGTLVNKISSEKPDAVFNTLNGDSNVAFFKQLHDAGITPQQVPVMSVSIAEQEVKGIGIANVSGELTAWNYYQTINTPTNTAFVQAYQAKYGADSVVDDPMEAGYTAVHLWAAAVTKAGTTNVDAVKAASANLTWSAPEGTVTIDPVSQHLYKTARIGVIQSNGLISEVWNSGGPIKPDPYLKGYTWWPQSSPAPSSS